MGTLYFNNCISFERIIEYFRCRKWLFYKNESIIVYIGWTMIVLSLAVRLENTISIELDFGIMYGTCHLLC